MNKKFLRTCFIFALTSTSFSVVSPSNVTADFDGNQCIPPNIFLASGPSYPLKTKTCAFGTPLRKDIAILDCAMYMFDLATRQGKPLPPFECGAFKTSSTCEDKTIWSWVLCQTP